MPAHSNCALKFATSVTSMGIVEMLNFICISCHKLHKPLNSKQIMDTQLAQALEYLLLATRGGVMRARILTTLRSKPQNMHQLAKHLQIDYKTAQHHIELLLKYQVLTAFNKGHYGAVYFIHASLKESWSQFDSIWNQFGRDVGKRS